MLSENLLLWAGLPPTTRIYPTSRLKQSDQRLISARLCEVEKNDDRRIADGRVMAGEN